MNQTLTSCIQTESYVYHIESDKFQSGNLLFTDWSALKTTDGNSTTVIAGNASQPAYREGIGENARFTFIKSFVQTTDNETILSDTGIACLRHVDRISEEVSTYAGMCDKPSPEQFSGLFAIIIDQKDLNRILATDSVSIKSVDTLTRNISTLYRGELRLRHMLQNTTSGDIYVTFDHGIALLNYTGNILMILAGSTSKGLRDGDFGKVQFNEPEEIISLSADFLLLADSRNQKLRLLNLRTKQSCISVCSGTSGSMNGNLTSCQLSVPRSLFKVNNTLYIGQNRYIREIGGKSLITTFIHY